jgi:aryl-alcohol dehydrogenase-like predicted oxidoreductase
MLIASEIYGEGESERIIGRLIKQTDEETKKKLFLATKCKSPIVER